MNPVRTDIKPLILTTAINEEDNTASLALAIEVVGYFDLDEDKATAIAKEVGQAVSKWCESAFEHEDLKTAISKRARSLLSDPLRRFSGCPRRTAASRCRKRRVSLVEARRERVNPPAR